MAKLFQPVAPSAEDQARRVRWQMTIAVATVAALAIGVGLLLRSQAERQRAQRAGGRRAQQIDTSLGETLLSSAMDTIARADEQSAGELMPRAIERLNQWVRLQAIPKQWAPDPLLESLPDAFRDLGAVKRLRDVRLQPRDSVHLHDALVLRTIARRVVGEEIADRERGKLLFDWVIRNIQLDPPPAPGQPGVAFSPGQTLALGHGYAEDRAWLFLLLARQLGLDAAMLAVRDADAPGGLRPWATGLLIQEQVYVFDTRLGLAVMNADQSQLATLAEIAGDDALLRRFDVSPELTYPVRAADAAACVALLEASTEYLARRMQLIEGGLSGDDRVILTTSPTRVAERFKACPQITEARLWTHPYETIVRANRREVLEATLAVMARHRQPLPPAEAPGGPEGAPRRRDPLLAEYHLAVATIDRARTAHLQGNWDGPGGAKRLYRVCRPRTLDLKAHGRLNAEQQAMVLQVKLDASYWMGLLAYDAGDLPLAGDFFLRRTLQPALDGFWAPGARYNLARVRELTGKVGDAIWLLEHDDSAQRHGNLARAKQLRAAHPGAVVPGDAPAASESPLNAPGEADTTEDADEEKAAEGE